jgi:hypothetical protein
VQGNLLAYLQLSTEPASAETLILKQSAAFFLRFEGADSSQASYQSIDNVLLVRFPPLAPAAQTSLIRSIRAGYAAASYRWQRLGMHVPKGYIYVWFLADADEMREEFQVGETTRAFTLPSRFIVIPYSISSRLREALWDSGVDMSDPEVERRLKAFLDEGFKETLTHELIHAFMTSSMGWKAGTALPTWFTEGLALWMSRARDVKLTDDYRDYLRIFEFLRMKYGNRETMRLAEEVVQHKNLEKTLANLRFPSGEDGLLAAARQWRVRRERAQYVLIVLLLAVASLPKRFASAGWHSTPGNSARPRFRPSHGSLPKHSTFLPWRWRSSQQSES